LLREKVGEHSGRREEQQDDKRCCCVCEEEHGWTEMFQENGGWFGHPSFSHDDFVSSWNSAEIVPKHNVNAVMSQSVCHLLGRSTIIVNSFESSLCLWQGSVQVWRAVL